MAKPIYVFRVEYEKENTMSAWTAFIGAHTAEEAEKFITRIVGPIRVLSAGMSCRLDDLSFEVKERVIKAWGGVAESEGKDIAIEKLVKDEATPEKKTAASKLKK